MPRVAADDTRKVLCGVFLSDTGLADRLPGMAAPPSPAPLPPKPRDRRDLIRLAVGFYGLVLLFAVGYALFSKHPMSVLLGENAPTVLHMLAAVGLGLVIVGLTRVALRMWSSVDKGAHALAEILGPLTWKQAAILAAVSAIGEEVLFRGALFATLGFVGSSLLFGLVHVVPRRALWMYPVFAVGMGFVHGLLRDGTGSIVPPIITHFVVNALNLHFLGSMSPVAEAGDSHPAEADPAPKPKREEEDSA